ncbi:MAG: 30S ribosomal protein S9 [Alphaproteobacteria bacterium]|nr:30S ribosomal protein S9 [Alphaproteobacteria bacterium]
MTDLKDLKQEVEATATEAPVERKAQIDDLGRAYATGKKKKWATARVWVKAGTGKVEINGKELPAYFARKTLQMIVNHPFVVAGVEGQFDVKATVKGGGLSGQAHAVKHGIAVALNRFDPALRAALKKEGLLTRDARINERHKYGLHKSRRAKQWAKR